MLVIPDEGKIDLLSANAAFGSLSLGTIQLKLFQNNYTPVDSSVSGNFTEANFTGYSAKTLTPGTWTTPTIVSGSAKTVYGSTPLTWTCGVTTNTIYGYYVVSAATGHVLWAERFAVSRGLTAGDELDVTPVMNDTYIP